VVLSCCCFRAELSARLLLNLRGAKRQEHSEIVMLKPSQLFPTQRPYSTQYEPRSPGYNSGFVFASHVDSNYSGLPSQDGTPRSPRRFSFSSTPRSPTSGPTTPTSPFYFPHPDDSPRSSTKVIMLAPPPQRRRKPDSLRPHWAREEGEAESSARKQQQESTTALEDAE